MNLQVLFCFFIPLITSSFAKSNRIIGGALAHRREFPHQVAFILLDPDKVVCGGSIIGHWYILTAAHCMYEKEEHLPNLRVFPGIINSKNRRGKGYPIAKSFIHPQYTGEMTDKSLSEHDIAVVKLEIAIIFNEYQNQIKLPSDNISPGVDVFVSGWGATIYPDGFSTDFLRKLPMEILKHEECRKYFPVTTAQFCTFNKSETGVCNGDSGGPVTYNGELIGIISYNVPCARGKPDVHTKVFSYLSFIKSIIETNNIA